MVNEREFPSLIYKGMMVVTTLVWGASFVMMKDAMEVAGPATIIGIRFVLTGVLCVLLLVKRVKRAWSLDTLRAGVILGLLDFVAFWIQTTGLHFTTPGKNAFLTGTYCVIVPFAYWLIVRRKPTRANLVAALLCIVGVGFVSLNPEDLSVGFGDMMSLVSAFFFAIHIVYVAKLSPGRDVLVLTAFQFCTEGFCGLTMGALFETAPVMSAITPEFIWNMAYLVVFASAIAFMFQNIGLAHVPPAQGAIILSLEAVFGVVFSIILTGEAMSFQLVFGFALIFVAILVSELTPLLRASKNKRELKEAPILK